MRERKERIRRLEFTPYVRNQERGQIEPEAGLREKAERGVMRVKKCGINRRPVAPLLEGVHHVERFRSFKAAE